MMKKIIMNICMLAVTILMVTSCDENYPIMYDASNIVVGLSKSALSVKENATGSFDVYLGGITGTEATDVVLQVSIEGIAKPAIEGTDFTLSSKNVSTPVGVTAVTVSPIDNSVFTGNKQFKVMIASNSKNYPITPQNTITVTIVDDEHPLKNWIGSYTVAAASYGKPGAWDEEWTVTTAPVASDVTKLSITGISGPGSGPVIATLNTTAMTIEMASAQTLGAAYGVDNGPVSIYYATDEIFGVTSGYVTSAMLTAAAAYKMTGTIEANGTIKIDRISPILTDYVYAWDVFNTTWTKN
jgi:hypothetical protein